MSMKKFAHFTEYFLAFLSYEIYHLSSVSTLHVTAMEHQAVPHYFVKIFAFSLSAVA